MEDRSNLDPYAKHFAKARKEIININRKAYGEKKRAIKRLAENLAIEGMPLHKICSETVRRLQDIVSPRFARRCLDSKYKDCRQSCNARKQAGKRRKNQQITCLAAHVPPEGKHEKQLPTIAVTVDSVGIASQDHYDLPHHPTQLPRVVPGLDAATGGTPDSEEIEGLLCHLKRFVVLKPGFPEVIEALRVADKRCYLYFDDNGEMVRVEPDSQSSVPQMQAQQRLDDDKAGELFAQLFLLGQGLRRR